MYAANTATIADSDNESVDSNRGQNSHLSYKEKRREAHTQAEQKRRNAIKLGYEALQQLVPACQKQNDNLFSGHKCNKATILQKSIEHIQFLDNEKGRERSELEMLRKEVTALQIINRNYEQMVSEQRIQFGSLGKHLSEEITFSVEQLNENLTHFHLKQFQIIMDQLFELFEPLSMRSFSEISANIFDWLENNFRPHKLKQLVLQSLQTHNSFMLTYQN